MFPVTITLNDVAQLNAVMAALALTPEAPKAEVVKKEPATKKPAATQGTPASGQPTATADVGTAAPEKTVAESSPTAAPAEVAQPASTAAEKFDYALLQKAVMKLHSIDPSAPVPIAKSLGFPTFKALPEDKWAEAHRLVTEAIAAKEVA